jgi:hypothetical protein
MALNNRPKVSDGKRKPGRKGEQIIPNETRLRQYWETLKEHAKEGDPFSCAALIILTQEHKLVHTKLTDMALLCNMFQEQKYIGKKQGEDSGDDQIS